MRDGNLGYFIGTVGYGLVYFNGTTISRPHGLGVQRGAGRQVHAIMRDNEGGIPTTTSGRTGSDHSSPSSATPVLPTTMPGLCRLQKDGTFWMGVGIEGMYRWKQGTISGLLRFEEWHAGQSCDRTL